MPSPLNARICVCEQHLNVKVETLNHTRSHMFKEFITESQ